MSEMSWQLRHPEYGLMRIDLEETTAREGWTGKYLDFKRVFLSPPSTEPRASSAIPIPMTRPIAWNSCAGTATITRPKTQTASSWWSAAVMSCRSFAGKARGCCLRRWGSRTSISGCIG